MEPTGTVPLAVPSLVVVAKYCFLALKKLWTLRFFRNLFSSLPGVLVLVDNRFILISLSCGSCLYGFLLYEVWYDLSGLYHITIWSIYRHLNIANFIYKPKFTDLLRNNKDNQDKLAILSSGHNIGFSNHKNYFRDLVRMKWVKFIKTTSEWRHKHAVMEDVQR
ncbi:hypothetical protein NQ317_015617 [Molorchus minor]|uniref:Uncharacterized protein n=1 Tax=Molorchus minor TaxID=1323400 RepID=A0ABQ9JSY9_9CUCU|nr:hypothetical protein NQ317_015617 [Molorchus minor]